MKKFITLVIVFFFLIFLIFFIINEVIKYANLGVKQDRLKYEELCKQNVNANAVIFGTSHAVYGIRPSLLDISGLSFYNFAFDGSNPEFYLNWYLSLFKNYYQKPKYCIFVIDWFLFDETWLSRKYEDDSQFFPYSVFIKDVCIGKYDKNKLLFNRFSVGRYRTIKDIKNVKNRLIHKNTQNDCVGYDNGFVPLFTYSKNDMNNNKPVVISDKQVNIFRKLITLLIKQDIKIIFVNTPEYGRTRQSYMKMKSFYIINNIAEEYKIPVLNYNIELRTHINDSTSYYRDWGHLNSKGSIEFSKRLNSDLKRIILIEK